MKFDQLSFPNAPLIKTLPPGPISRQYLDYQFSHESSAVSYPRGIPIAIRRAKGATVEDLDGNIYIDFFGGAGVMNVGHSNPEVVQAAREQLDNFTHALDISGPARKTMVENLVAILPTELNKILFGGPTGSDAVESALKLAKSKKYSLVAN